METRLYRAPRFQDRLQAAPLQPGTRKHFREISQTISCQRGIKNRVNGIKNQRAFDTARQIEITLLQFPGVNPFLKRKTGIKTRMLA